MSDLFAGVTSSSYTSGSDSNWSAGGSPPYGRFFSNPGNVQPGVIGDALIANDVVAGPSTYRHWIEVDLGEARAMLWSAVESNADPATNLRIFASASPMPPIDPTRGICGDPGVICGPTPITEGWTEITGTWTPDYIAPGTPTVGFDLFEPTGGATAAFRYWALMIEYFVPGLTTTGWGISEWRAESTVPAAPDPGPIIVVEDPDGVVLADLTDEVYDVKVRIALNDPGWGSFKVNRHSTLATAAVLKPGNYVRVTIPQIDPNPIFGFFLEGSAAPDTPTIKLVSSDEEGGEEATFGGRGSLSYWDRAIWLAQSFVVPWWPSYISDEHGDPPAGTLGAIHFNPGSYARYTTSGNQITSKIPFTTAGGFSSYYDRRKRYYRVISGITYWTTLVHLTTGAVAGWYVKPWGSGVVEYKAAAHYRFGNSILMESIDDGDKPGQVIYEMYQESQAADRPVHPLPGMTVDFDATNDSDGNPWTVTDALKAVSAELGDDYLSTIGKLTNTGAVDVYMDPDLGMHAYNSYGRDLTASVRFAKGLNIADELQREYSDAPIGTFAEVQGSSEGVIARVIVAGDPPREISVRGDSDDVDVLEALGEAELALRTLHSDSVGFGVDTPIVGHEDPGNGLYLPGPPDSANGDYWIGDLVTLHTGTDDHDFDEDTVRIAAITLTFTEANDLRATPEVISGFGGVPTLGSPSSGGPTATIAGVASTVSDLYQLVSEKDQPFGYPSLDDDGLIDRAEIPVVEALRTDETDTTLVLAPDGAGGLAFRPETGGSCCIPVTAYDPAVPGWMIVVDGDGNAVMSEG